MKACVTTWSVQNVERPPGAAAEGTFPPFTSGSLMDNTASAANGQASKPSAVINLPPPPRTPNLNHLHTVLSSDRSSLALLATVSLLVYVAYLLCVRLREVQWVDIIIYFDFLLPYKGRNWDFYGLCSLFMTRCNKMAVKLRFSNMNLVPSDKFAF